MLDQVAWVVLRHNYGKASDVPALLRESAVADRERALRALDELDNVIYHQGGWICPAAPATLPYLVDLAHEPTVEIRPDVVNLIGRLVGEATTVQLRHLDPGWPEALKAQVPRLLALLADPDPRVRREATVLAGCGGMPFSDTIDVVWQRWTVEDDPITRRDLVLAFGSLLAARPDLPDAAEIRVELLALLRDGDLQTRLAAIHALADSEPDVAVAEVAVAVAAVRHPDATDWQESAWIGGTRETIIRATGRLVRHDATAATAFTLGVGGGRRSGADRDEADRDEADRDELVAALGETGSLLQEWRTVAPAVLPLLADCLDHADVEIRYRAVYLVGCVGRDAASLTEAVAILANDRTVRDSRHQSTVGDAAVWALARLQDPRCVAGLDSRLRGARLGFDPNAAFFTATAIFPFWPPGIEETLIPLRQYAADLLPALAARSVRDGESPWIARVRQAWSTDGVVPTLAATPADQLRRLTTSADDWTRLRAAHALWHHAADPDTFVPTFLDLAAPSTDGRCLPVSRAALRYLADAGIASVPAAAIATAVLANPWRLTHSGGWRAFVEDDEVRDAATKIVRNSSGPSGGHVGN